MTDQEIENFKADRDQLECALKQAGTSIRGNTCKCPYHDDRHASAGIFQAKGSSTWLFGCRACNISYDVFTVLAKNAGLTAGEVIKQMTAAAPKPMNGHTAHNGHPKEPEAKTYPTVEALRGAVESWSDCREVQAMHIYANPLTRKTDLIVIRWWSKKDDRKKFIQCGPVPGGFSMKKPEGLAPLYNRLRVREADEVLVVEGEKCVERLTKIGIVATTSPGGAAGAKYADWSPLAGKTITLWPDADHPKENHPEGVGVSYMREVMEICKQLNPPAKVRWIDQTKLELPDGGDAVDFLAAFEDQGKEYQKLAIESTIADAVVIGGAAAETTAYLEEIIAGKHRPIPLPFPKLHKMTNALVPGSITVFCGSAGGGKSWFIMQCLLFWTRQNIKACAYTLEETDHHNRFRMLAMLESNTDLTDNAWIEANPLLARTAMKRQADVVDQVAPLIYAKAGQHTLKDVQDYIAAKVASGHEVIVIDPITAAVAADKPWIEDLKFINEVKDIIHGTNSRVLLTTHPRKGKAVASMEDMAGGVSYSRFTQCIMWLEKHKPAKKFNVFYGGIIPNDDQEIDRVIHILKARNAKGDGFRVGFNWKEDAVMFDEIGYVINEVK